MLDVFKQLQDALADVEGASVPSNTTMKPSMTLPWYEGRFQVSQAYTSGVRSPLATTTVQLTFLCSNKECYYHIQTPLLYTNLVT